MTTDWTRGEYSISTDPGRIDINACERLLRETIWAEARPRQTIEKSIRNSLTFGLFHGARQIGLARVVTDLSTFAWLCDVIIEEEFRGKGLGKWLTETIVNHPDLLGLRYFVLATRDAHALYEQFGFARLERPELWMGRMDPDVSRVFGSE